MTAQGGWAGRPLGAGWPAQQGCPGGCAWRCLRLPLGCQPLQATCSSQMHPSATVCCLCHRHADVCASQRPPSSCRFSALPTHSVEQQEGCNRPPRRIMSLQTSNAAHSEIAGLRSASVEAVVNHERPPKQQARRRLRLRPQNGRNA